MSLHVLVSRVSQRAAGRGRLVVFALIPSLILCTLMLSGCGERAGRDTRLVVTGSTTIQFDLYDTPIAYDAIAVIVHPDNPIDDLSTEQLRANILR